MCLRFLTVILALCAMSAAAIASGDAPQRPSDSASPEIQIEQAALAGQTSKPVTGPQAGDVRLDPVAGKEMVFVPAGEFLMGPAKGPEGADDHPERRVYLDSFWIDKAPVTNAEYRRFTNATGYPLPKYADDPEYNQPDHPVVGVSWEDAIAYARWSNKRLPTDAEWEKAARGMDGRTYPWGNAWDVSSNPRANFADRNASVYPWADRNADDRCARTSAVGSFPQGASPYGCLDMAGNVWEWCADWYDTPHHASASASTRNPEGPPTGTLRVLRGGAWNGTREHLQTTYRVCHEPSYRAPNFGFRCVSSER